MTKDLFVIGQPIFATYVDAWHQLEHGKGIIHKVDEENQIVTVLTAGNDIFTCNFNETSIYWRLDFEKLDHIQCYLSSVNFDLLKNKYVSEDVCEPICNHSAKVINSAWLVYCSLQPQVNKERKNYLRIQNQINIFRHWDDSESLRNQLAIAKGDAEDDYSRQLLLSREHRIRRRSNEQTIQSTLMQIQQFESENNMLGSDTDTTDRMLKSIKKAITGEHLTLNEEGECVHLTTTLFHNDRAECFGCGAIVSLDRVVLEPPKYVPSGLEQIELAVKNAKALAIQQGQRFNEQSQHVKDLEYRYAQLQKLVDGIKKIIKDACDSSGNSSVEIVWDEIEKLEQVSNG